MKNKIMSSSLALSLLVGSVSAFADGSTSTASSPNSVSITINQTQVHAVDPDSLLYALNEWLNQIKLLLTIQDTEKVELLLKQANEKISELETLKENGTDQYQEAYSEKINELLKKTDQVLKEASTNLEKEDKETREKEKQEIEKQQMAFTEVQKHSIAVLKANLEKVPEQGQKGIRNAIAKQEAKLKGEEATSESDQRTVVQATVEQNSVVKQSWTAETTVITQQKEVKVKDNNGLHLGQVKHGKEKEKQKPNEK